jgi:hypothetical protein
VQDPWTPSYAPRWSPAPGWLGAGLVLGPLCGAGVGATLFVVGSAMDGYGLDLASAVLGLRLGAVFGVVIGLVVGFAMALLVGSRLTTQQTRERAFLWCFSTGLITLPVATILFAFHPVGILIGFGSALAVGTLGYRLASSI